MLCKNVAIVKNMTNGKKKCQRVTTLAFLFINILIIVHYRLPDPHLKLVEFPILLFR